MLFKQAFHPAIIDGSITLTFRRWKRRQVKAGGSYRFGSGSTGGALEVSAVDVVSPDTITDAEARRAGFDDRAALLDVLGPAGTGASDEPNEVFRVEFSFVRRADERVRLAADADLDSAGRDEIAVRLAGMDSRSRRGPWTAQTLEVIAEQPRVAASKLAPLLGMETAPFKANVRKLKALGLTISHETGYELSPRGHAFHATPPGPPER